MTPELVALAHRVVSCKGWRWLPGMLAWRQTHHGERVRVRLVSGVSYAAELLDPHVINSTPEGKLIAASAHAVVDGWHRVEELLPELADPATLGCLLALVREAWGDPYLCCVGDVETGWRLDGYAAVEDIHSYRSEAEALVAALEKAP